ncbi:MAG: exo-alpha-sialidase [Candidatus Binataceae bacterium]|nr:exo-alpha-sialidase [Candidatus Binataceae bacterium]
MATVILGPRCNRRVTCDASPSNDRAESALAANPLDSYNMVGASKRFINPATYTFSLAAYATFDGGQSWTEAAALTLPPGAIGTSDPAVAWDDAGNAYLVALPFGAGLAIIGICVYKSTDGGRSWGPPLLIHSSSGDDKQWADGDGSATSPYKGNVYAAWDNGSSLAFARTTDHGSTWKGIKIAGVDQPAGTALPGIGDSFSPEIAIAHDGTVYITWIAGLEIKFVKSTNGGDSFTAAAVVVSGITTLNSSLPAPHGFPNLPGGTFRVDTFSTCCTGLGNNVAVAWADYREGVSRIYYRHSINGGSSWVGVGSGQPLLTGAAASPAGKHDFHPQLMNTPSGEIGCTFYEFGPAGGGEFPLRLIDVILAVSTNNGSSFPNRVTVTESPWDPTVDAPTDEYGNTFIGDYFGLAASPLGFFPFWTDTRTGVQEIFTTRISVHPADLYIRDSSSDIGNVPSPGFHWEAPDLIVRQQADGDVHFVNQDVMPGQDNYVYGRVTNAGPNDGKNVKLAVTVGNYPSLEALPGAEFRYPQDWYQGDWNTAALQANHTFLGESAGITVHNGATKILGPLVWPAAEIPAPHTWHPCLLAEVRSDNDDSAGGTFGCDISADPNPCAYGSYFWGNNNVCQRNISYAAVHAKAATRISLPFIVGSVWSTAQFLEVIVDKGCELADVPMTLHMEPMGDPQGEPCCEPGEIVFTDKCRVIVRVGECDAGEITATPGTVWRPICPPSKVSPPVESCHGGERTGREWRLTQRRASVGFAVAAGELRKMTLSFTSPTTLQTAARPLIQIYQRNDHRVITGSVMLEIRVA